MRDKRNIQLRNGVFQSPEGRGQDTCEGLSFSVSGDKAGFSKSIEKDAK